MKSTLKLVVVVFAACSAASAQVVPSATASGARLSYSARYSQAVELYGGKIGTTYYGVTSGNVDYTNGIRRHPFSLDFGGGYAWALSSAPNEVGFFENLYLLQGFVGRRWNLQASDKVTYTPQAPIGGFSGEPGTGEPIGVTPPTTTSQSILTVNTHVVDNATLVNYVHELNYATTLTVGGGLEILRYPDNDGLDVTTENADGGVSWRLNARSSVSGQYFYSDFTFPDSNAGVQTNTAFVKFERSMTRRVNLKLSAGPEWITGSGTTSIQPITTVAASALINYQMEFSSASLGYSRGTNGGGGYLVGGITDSVFGNFSRVYGKNVTIGMTGGYDRTAGLSDAATINSRYGEAQITRQLGRDFMIFANYTGMDQWSADIALPNNVLGQFYQVIGIGVGFSPREKHLRQ